MTSKEKVIKAIEALDEVKSEISEVRLKLCSLETTSIAIIAVVGETNIDKERNKLRLFEAALEMAETSECKASTKKEIDAIKSRISSYEQLESIISEKEELSKKYDPLLKEYKKRKCEKEKYEKLYSDECATFEAKIFGENVANDNKTSETCSEIPVDNTDSETIIVNDDTGSESNSTTVMESVSEVTSDEDEENSESNSLLDHPLMGVLNVMSVYNDLYTYDTKTTGEKYSVAYSNLWKDIQISKEDESFISMLCKENADIPGMTNYQVRKLVLSLPTELLKKIGCEDIIEERKAETENYVKGGRNNWRSEFTYSLICDLAELVFNKVKATSPEEAEKYEYLIDKFMERNTDHLSGKVIKKCVKGAFCIVD